MRGLGLMAVGLLYLVFLNGELGSMFGDDARYVGLAQSLATGQGYRSIWAPGNPPQTHSPFLFPLLLAPVVAFAGINFWWMHFLVIVSALVAVWLTAQVFQDRLDPPGPSWVTWLTALSPVLLAHLLGIMADLPMMAFSLLAILWIERYLKTQTLMNRQGALAVFALLAAVFTRWHGLGLWLALGGLLWRPTGVETPLGIRQKRLQVLALMGITALPIGGWMARAFLLKESTDWNVVETIFWRNDNDHSLGFINLEIFLHRLLDNARLLLEEWPRTLSGFHHFSLDRLWERYGVVWILMANALGWLGFLRRCRRRPTLVEWYLIGEVLMLLAQLLSYGATRYLLPLVPFLWYYVFSGLQGVCQQFLRHGRKSLAAAVSLACAMTWMATTAAIDARILRYRVERFGRTLMPPTWWELVAACAWLKGHTAPETVLMADVPAFVYLLADRKSDLFPRSSLSGDLLREIQQSKARYWVVDSYALTTQTQIRPLVASRPERFRIVAQFGGTDVVEVLAP